MTQPELGKKIVELRLLKGLTQAELAESCNLNVRTIQRIETSEVTPRSYTVKAIFSALGNDITNLPDAHSSGKTGRNSIKKRLERSFAYVQELFNLKTNTMKKLSVLTAFAVLVAAGIFLTHNTLKSQDVPGWFLAGSAPKSYSIGLDQADYKSQPSSAYLASKGNSANGFGTLMQTSSAEKYLGKRVKMTGYIKAENVSDWAGMWMRVDSKTNKSSLSFDNMSNRPIKGSKDWTKYEIVLDVPVNSGTLNYGVLLGGTGKVWLDDISFEVVDDSVETTSPSSATKAPSNLDFSK